jgi:hypothetical protein
MANRRILLDPSKWVVNEDHKVSLRYRVVTNDLNVRSAYSPVYKVQVPEIEDIFSSITGLASKTVSGSNTVINVTWTTAPVYNNFNYYIFIKKPGETSYSFVKSTQTTSFAYVAPNTQVGQYDFIISMPTTTKTPLENARLFLASATI